MFLQIKLFLYFTMHTRKNFFMWFSHTLKIGIKIYAHFGAKDNLFAIDNRFAIFLIG